MEWYIYIVPASFFIFIFIIVPFFIFIIIDSTISYVPDMPDAVFPSLPFNLPSNACS